MSQQEANRPTVDLFLTYISANYVYGAVGVDTMCVHRLAIRSNNPLENMNGYVGRMLNRKEKFKRCIGK